LFAALFSSLAFVGCNFDELQTPKEIKVRTDATYEFSVMSFDSEKEGSKLKLSDYFDLSKTLEEKTSESADSKDMKVYKYNDGSQFQQFLIHMPLDEVDFDFTETFKDMDFSKSVENFNMDKEIEIPVIETPEKEEPIDLSDVHKQLNKGVKFGGTNTGANLSVIFGTVDGKLDFSSITYSSGYLVVEGAGGDTITGTVELFDDSTSLGSATFNAGVAKIDLANKTIKKSGMKLTFSDTGKNFLAQVQEDSKIKTAAGVTLAGEYAPVVTPSNITFPFSLSSDVKSCEITDGSLTVQIKRPSGWASVITSYTINLSGGLTETFNQSNATETYYYNSDSDKHTKTLSNGDIIASPSVTVVINDANLDFEHGPSVYAKVVIKEISATVKLADDYETSITKNEPVTSDITDSVNMVVWNPSGFNVNALNDLPEGNDIILRFNSTFFDMTNVEKTIEAKGSNAQMTKYAFTGNETKTWFIDVPTGETGTKYTTIPLSGEIELPGYKETAGEKTITVKRVEPGKTYHINITAEPLFDWKSANVKLPDDKTHFNDKMNTGMNKKTLFSALGDSFGDNVKIRKMPLYVFANIPDDMRDKLSFKGSINAVYRKDVNGVPTELSPSVQQQILPDNSVINANNALPIFEKNEANEITNTFKDEDKTAEFSEAMNLVANEGTLYLDYDIKIEGENNGIDIEKTKMDELEAQGKSTIKIDIVVLLTMDFTVINPVDIDMLAFANKKDGDLLGRSEATEASKYLDVIKSATISIEKFMLPMTGDISLSIDSKGDGTDVVKKAVGNGETYSIEVNPKEMLSTYPYSPNIKFVLEKGNFGILRTMPISGKIKLRVKAKGDIPIFSFAEQE
ncbi:MAG: Ig-like domain repeat protein, partial [Treponema sp.]|nr:Ig-like domain repeat protein [Treponema sp.]